jgi:SAM-dependent methyltransferase
VLVWAARHRDGTEERVDREDYAIFDARMADVYDEWFGRPEDADDAATFLAGLAGAGPVLELGIGTGRVALPLARQGVEVHGIDASEAMVEKLKGKPGGADLPVTIGDFTEVEIEGSFSLAYVVFNTIFDLLTQDKQVRCFENVARHLRVGGRFVVEAFVPDPTRFVADQITQTKHVGEDGIVLEASRHDPVNQRVDSQHVALSGAGARLWPVTLRYAWPSELDLMARLAGLRLRNRFGGWRREPFGASSTKHVSVYGAA